MNEQEQVLFCPRCGTVLRDGVCQSCGYEAPKQNEQIGGMIYNAPDVYQSQVGGEIYQSPDTEAVSHDTGGRFSGALPVYDGYNNAPNAKDAYNGNRYTAGSEYSSTQSNNSYGVISNADYRNIDNGYAASQYSDAGNAYGNSQYQNNNNTYAGGTQYQNNSNAYVGGAQYQNNSDAYVGGAQYQNNGNNYAVRAQYQNNGNFYAGGTQYQNNGNAYGNGQFSNAGNDYGKNQYQSNNNPYGGGGQYGYDYGYNNNPYSPYAVPQKNKHTGLIIGVIITVVALFLIALLALIYRAFDSVSEPNRNNNAPYYDGYYYNYDDYNYDDYNYDDHYYDNHYYDDHYYDDHYYDDHYYDDHYYDDYYYDYDNDYGYNYDYNYNYDFNRKDYNDNYDYDADKYYTLHDDVKKDLSYTIGWESYEYDTDKKNVTIFVDYPVIEGKNVPNLDKINETIADELKVITEYFEEDYSKYMLDEDDYFVAYSEGYVTYMSEDVLSIAFSEYIYSDYYNMANLYCINIDMKDGVILDNTGIIDVDDEFSVDFRKRSDTQNGTISSLTMMTDQEITNYLTSEDNLIIFYTPQGMEIGFNYSEGWVTVTYKDYKDFLKIF